jgi:hypothetical protein
MSTLFASASSRSRRSSDDMSSTMMDRSSSPTKGGNGHSNSSGVNGSMGAPLARRSGIPLRSIANTPTNATSNVNSNINEKTSNNTKGSSSSSSTPIADEMRARRRSMKASELIDTTPTPVSSNTSNSSNGRRKSNVRLSMLEKENDSNHHTNTNTNTNINNTNTINTSNGRKTAVTGGRKSLGATTSSRPPTPLQSSSMPMTPTTSSSASSSSYSTPVQASPVPIVDLKPGDIIDTIDGVEAARAARLRRATIGVPTHAHDSKQATSSSSADRSPLVNGSNGHQRRASATSTTMEGKSFGDLRKMIHSLTETNETLRNETMSHRSRVTELSTQCESQALQLQVNNLSLLLSKYVTLIHFICSLLMYRLNNRPLNK